MPTIGDEYWAIVIELKSILSNLTDDQGAILFKEVELGIAAKIDVVPSAYIIPENSSITVTTVEHEEYTFRFRILIVAESSTSEDAFNRAVDLAGYVINSLKDNHNLNGTCDRFLVTGFRPIAFARRGQLRSYVSIDCEATIWR